MSTRTCYIVLAIYLVVFFVAARTSPHLYAFLWGCGIACGVVSSSFGILLNRSHKQWKEQADLTDQAIKLAKTILEQRDDVKRKLDETLDLVRRYQDQRNNEGEEWKNG